MQLTVYLHASIKLIYIMFVSVDILFSQQDYNEESVFKQLLGLKDRHIQVNANIHIIPWFNEIRTIYGWRNGLSGDLC